MNVIHSHHRDVARNRKAAVLKRADGSNCRSVIKSHEGGEGTSALDQPHGSIVSTLHHGHFTRLKILAGSSNQLLFHRDADFVSSPHDGRPARFCVAVVFGAFEKSHAAMSQAAEMTYPSTHNLVIINYYPGHARRIGDV